MNIDGIISISGKPGLFNVVAQGKARIIIEDIETNKRRPAFATDRVIALNDITVFGYAEDLTLAEVFEKIFDKEKGKKAIAHKSETAELRAYFESVWGDYNDEEVADHDIKKIIQWYNMLVANKILKKEKKAPTKKAKKEVVKEEEE
jgi:hypothetical protein